MAVLTNKSILITCFISVIVLQTACGGGGGGGGAPATPVIPANQVPTSDAGSDQAAEPGADVTLTGSGSDIDGTIASFLWTQTSGTTVSLNNSDAASASFTAPDNEGDLVFQLEVADDDGATTTDTVNVTVADTIAPTLVSMSPVDGSVVVSRDKVIATTFSEALQASTVDESSLFLTTQAGDPVLGAVVVANQFARFTPDQTLKLLNRYTATVTSAITDLFGNNLAAVNWQFTTEDGSWGIPELAETIEGVEASNPQIAMDPSGNALAVWHQYNNSSTETIRANLYTPGAGWGSSEIIVTGNAGIAGFPNVAMDTSGNGIAVWTQFDGTPQNIWSNRYTAGVGWGTAELIETDNAGDAGGPQVVMDVDGNGIAVWFQFDGTRNNIWSNRYTVSVGWGSPELIETDNSGGAALAQVAADANGDVIAVWQQSDGVRVGIWSSRYTVGVGWGTAELIDADNTDPFAAKPQVAVGANGDVFAVWEQRDSVFSIWSNHYTAGVGWNSAELIETLDTGDAQNPEVMVDANGQAVAVWHQSDGTRDSIWSNHYTAGEGWGDAELIETDDTGSATAAQMAMDANGNALAVWNQSDGTRSNIWSNRYTAGTGWGSAELIETNDISSAFRPKLAIDANGEAMAVWWQFDGTDDNIYSNRFE